MIEENQEIDLIELLRVVLKNWWLIILLTLIAAATSYLVTKEYVTPIYEAKATLFIGKETDSIAGFDLSVSDLQLDNQLVVDYRELIKTRLITEEVILDLALLAEAEDLVKNLGISTISESRFMYVTYQDPIPERAAQIANRLSEVLAEKAEEIVGVKNVRIVDQAIVPEQPISPNTLMNTAIAGVLGAMIALFIIFIRMMLDNTIKTEEDIEKFTGLPVLGVIPEFKGEVRS